MNAKELTCVTNRIIIALIGLIIIYNKAPHCVNPLLCRALRSSGSTKAAIVALLHTVRTMLAENDFVHVFSFDFSKAFDTVKHESLMTKLAQLEIPDCVLYNWVIDFFDSHAHCMKYAGLVSAIAIIHSGIGNRTSLVHCHRGRPPSGTCVQ